MTDAQLPVPAPGPKNLITDVGGIEVGNAEDDTVRSGVTVVLPNKRMVAGGDIRGGAPGTRETSLLDPSCMVEEIDAIVLSGGSAYGLDSAGGVANWLGARGRGLQVASTAQHIPVVPAAIIFDLANGGNKEWGETPPYHTLGPKACQTAAQTFSLGNAGAGLGAQAGTLKGGLGSASLVTPDGFRVGALMVVNALGSAIIPGSRAFWAAPYEREAEFGGIIWPASFSESHYDILAGSKLAFTQSGNQTPRRTGPANNTTIGVVAVNARLTPAECRRIAIMAHDGMARAIRPIHTPFDGDTIFVLATGEKEPDRDMRLFDIARLGAWSADCVSRACARGVYEAGTLGDITAYGDLP